MNYVHNSLQFLLQVLSSTITWLFSTEIISYNNTSISIGQTFVYFFIVYLVISLLLNATFSNIGQVHKEHVKKERTFNKNVKIHVKQTKGYVGQSAENFFNRSYDFRNR